MKSWMKYLGESSPFSFFLLLAILIPSSPDLLRQQTFWVIALFIISFSAQIGARLGSFTAGIALTYFLGRAASTWAARFDVPYWASDAAAQSFCWLILFTAVVAYLSPLARYKVLNALSVLCIVASCVMVARKCMGIAPAFILNNPAADASLVAVLFPLVAMRSWWVVNRSRAVSVLVYGLPVAAVMASGSSTATATLCLSIFLYTVQLRNLFPTAAWIRLATGSAVVMALVLGSLHFFSPDVPFQDSGRYKTWASSLRFITRNMKPEELQTFQSHTEVFTLLHLDRTSSPWIGAGAGSFRTLSEPIQLANGFPEGTIFPFAHSEPVHTAFDQGWWGVFFLVIVAAAGLWKALDRPWLFTSLFTYVFMACFNYPFRYPASAVIGLFLFAESFLHYCSVRKRVVQ